MPLTEDEWRIVANGFYNRWNFPNCLGALDGKHIYMRPPPNSGSLFYNYKRRFSIVLLALVDSDYNFLYVDIGAYGSSHDARVFEESSLKNDLTNGALNIPKPECLPNTNTKLPYMIIADEAFPMLENLMKPFAQRNLSDSERIFNYRLSRARRVVENAFGILSNRFRIFLKEMHISTNTVKSITYASCILHNYLKANHPDYVSRKLPESLLNMTKSGNNAPTAKNCQNKFKQNRESLKTYFMNEGGVDGQ